MCPSGLAEYYQCNNMYIKGQKSKVWNYKLRRFWSGMRAMEGEGDNHTHQGTRRRPRECFNKLVMQEVKKLQQIEKAQCNV